MVSNASVNLGSAHAAIIITTNVKDAINEFNRDLERGLSGLGSKFQRVGDDLTQIGVGLTALTAPLTAFTATGLRAFASLEETLIGIQARTGITDEELQKIDATVKELGANTVFSSQQAADALLQMMTAGMSLEEALATIEPVTAAAAAAQLDLGTAADLTTNVMSVFGLEADAAANTIQIINNAAAVSPASFTEMSEALQRAGGQAAMFGLDLDETAGILALFAQRGIRGSEAGTQLNSMLRNMSRDLPAVTETYERLGVSLYDQEGNVRDFETVLFELDEALADASDEERAQAFQTIFGAEGLQGALALLDGDTTISDITTQMSEQAAVGDVAASAMESLGNKFNSVQGSIETLQQTALGPFVENTLKPLLDRVIEITNAVTAWAARNPELTQRIIEVSMVVAALGVGLAVTGQTITMVTGIVAALAGVFTFLLSPIGLAIAAGVALVAAYTTNFMGFRDFVDGTIRPMLLTLMQALSDLWVKVQPHLQALANWFTGVAIPVIVATLNDVILPALSNFKTTLLDIWTAVQPSLEHLANFFSGVLLTAIQLIMEIALPALGVFAQFLLNLWDLVSPVLLRLSGWFMVALADAIMHLDTTLLPIIQGLANYLVGFWNLVQPGLLAFQNGMFSWMTFLRDNVLNPILDLIERIVGAVDGALDKLTNLKAAAERIPDIAGQISDLGRAMEENNVGGTELWRLAGNAIQAEFRDSGGTGAPGSVYAIGNAAGVEAFVSPRLEGQFIPNIDRVMNAAAALATQVDGQGSAGGGDTVNVHVEYNGAREDFPDFEEKIQQLFAKALRYNGRAIS